jgi:hypothetical protein
MIKSHEFSIKSLIKVNYKTYVIRKNQYIEQNHGFKTSAKIIPGSFILLTYLFLQESRIQYLWSNIRS